MITIEQCRAARGLLDWTQQDLAEASGLSKTAINNFEKGHSDIKAESLKALRMAFEACDVEFIGRDGIRRRTETLRMLRGPDCLEHLLDDIHESLKRDSGELLISHAGGHGLPRDIKTLTEHMLRIKKTGLDEKIICSETLMKELAPRGITCRCLPDDMIHAGPMTAIYGHKVAVAFHGGAIIAIIESTDTARAERLRFEEIWHRAHIPSAATFTLNAPPPITNARPDHKK
jgi:transcriptional regulator with XRE-family HTH domain